MQNLKKKYGNKALVTGGSSGIGKAFALELAKQGIEPILVARNKANLDIAAGEILNRYNQHAQVYAVDLSNEADTIQFLTQIEHEDIGLLIHSAGMENNGSFTKISTSQELKMIRLNIGSTYLLTKHFANKMTSKKKGGILLISSLAGLMPTPYFSNYGATKSYMYNLGLSLYTELKHNGVDISVLAPGLTETNMIINNGINWAKLPVTKMLPIEVVSVSMKNLGKRAIIIPGFRNKILVFLSKRIFSMKQFSLINGWMIRKAIAKEKL